VRRPTRARDSAPDATAAVERPADEARSAKVRFHKELGFAGGSSDLAPRMLARLDADARWLAANPGKSITVEGHASQVGSAELNQALSESRANAVKDYLVQQGVDAARIQVVGHGFDKPAYDPPSSARKRRVHIVVND
jgi:outer membrane protein OmpA-like peptidoglycan-associated protein